jgi:hypothetical protein
MITCAATPKLSQLVRHHWTGNPPLPSAGYDTFAADLSTLVGHPGLTGIVLTGFRMGTGEVARYLGIYGSVRVAGAAARLVFARDS